MPYKKPPKDGVRGTVYLLHFDVAFVGKPVLPTNKRQYVRHYIGWTENGLEARLAAHRDGCGARLMAVIKTAGIGFTLARTWKGTRRLERQIKNRGGAAKHCPLCKEEKR